MRAAGLFRVSDFRLPRAFVCARVSSFCVSGCTAFCKRWVFRSARRGLIPCFLLAACPFLLFARIRGAQCFTDGRLFPRSASDVVRSPRRGRGNAAPSHPSLCGTFSPEGAGRIWNRPRATAEHGHGALCFCKGENAGTALRVFARERTRARRSAFLQGRERGHGAPYVCKGKEYGRCVPHLCTRTVSAFVHGRGIRR